MISRARKRIDATVLLDPFDHQEGDRMMKTLVLAATAALLAGCGTTSGRLGPLPEVPDASVAAKVVVVRISSIVGAANGYTVAIDGKDIFGIGSGEHAEFQVSPGEHYLGVKCFGGFTPTWKEDSLKFDAAKASSNYFVVSPSMTCAAVRGADEAEAKKLLSGSKAVNLANPAGR
jgi:predicted small lipoprotein YifL